MRSSLHVSLPRPLHTSASTQASGAFSLGGGSYLRSIEDVVTINYEGIELKYSRPGRRPKRDLPADAAAREQIQQTLTTGMMEFFRSKNCHDAMTTSTQVVVIDITLPLSVAFISALENQMPFGILWDPEVSKYVGIMTVTDYIHVLLRTRQSGESIVELQNKPIREWRTLNEVCRREQGQRTTPGLVSARLDHDLLVALELLQTHKIKRLPILSHTGEVISTVGLSSMLRAVVQRLNEVESSEWHDLLSYGVKDLGIGVYSATPPRCTLEKRVHEVLSTLIDHQVHCLPILDEAGRCLDVFTRNDVMHIEQGGTYDIELTLATAIANRPRHPVYCYSPDDTLCEVMKHMGTVGVWGVVPLLLLF